MVRIKVRRYMFCKKLISLKENKLSAYTKVKHITITLWKATKVETDSSVARIYYISSEILSEGRLEYP